MNREMMGVFIWTLLSLSPNPTGSESPNKGKAAKHPVPHSWWNCSFLPWSSQRLNSLPKTFSFWPNLGTSPTTGRHVITHCLQPIKSPCFCLWGRLLCPWSLGLEVLSKRCFAQINLLHFFNLSWFGLLCRQRILLCIGVFHPCSYEEVGEAALASPILL